MKNSSLASESQVLPLSAEFTCAPMRSPATSIILAEAVRRSQERSEARRYSRPVLRLIRDFLRSARLSDVDLSGKVSIVFTPCGPLVYQWKGIYYGPEGRVE